MCTWVSKQKTVLYVVEMIYAEIYNLWYLSHKKVDIILFWSMLFFAFLKRKEIFFICVRKVQQLLPVTLKLYSDFSVELERRKLLVQKYENYLKCKWFEISFFFYILKQGYMKLINKIYARFVNILANMCLTYSLNETVFIHAILDWISHAFVSVSRMAFHHYVHAILIMHGYSLCKLKTMQSRSFAVSVLPVVLVYIRLFWIKYNIVIAKFSQILADIFM